MIQAPSFLNALEDTEFVSFRVGQERPPSDPWELLLWVDDLSAQLLNLPATLVYGLHGDIVDRLMKGAHPFYHSAVNRLHQHALLVDGDRLDIPSFRRTWAPLLDLPAEQLSIEPTQPLNVICRDLEMEYVVF